MQLRWALVYCLLFLSLGMGNVLIPHIGMMFQILCNSAIIGCVIVVVNLIVSKGKLSDKKIHSFVGGCMIGASLAINFACGYFFS